MIRPTLYCVDHPDRFIKMSENVYVDKANGNTFDGIEGSLNELNESPKVYLAVSRSGTYIGPDHNDLILYAKNRDSVEQSKTIKIYIMSAIVAVMFIGLIIM